MTDGDDPSTTEVPDLVSGATLLSGHATAAQPRPLKFDYLVAQRFVTREQLREALEQAREQRSSVESLLMSKYQVQKSHIGMSLSLYYRCPFVGLDARVTVAAELLKNLSPQRLRSGCWMATRCDDGAVTVVMKDPHDLPELDSIEHLFPGKHVKPAVGLPDEILNAIDTSFGRAGANRTLHEVSGTVKVDPADEDIAGGLEVSDNDSAVVRLAQRIVLDAYRDRASDIHIEPAHLRKQTVIRFRVDGSCLEYERIPGHLGKPLVARFKVLAHLDIAERRRPQDGKLRVRLPDREVELRIATIPTVGGNEDAVLRMLPAQDVIPLDRQALKERNLRELKAIAEKPYGLILCVGPTGSGKTTTLHAVLDHINTSERKIWTAEDPVEITQPGLRQVQIMPKIGFTFAAAMRAFLRSDPDVIMVGEMRDMETAAIAVEASLTGHLVLSTLHTNSAAETIGRLLDLGLDPFNFADALLGVLAQRLVKRLCPECREPSEALPDEAAELARAYGEEEFRRLRVGTADGITLERARGCAVCKQTGYWGRAAIHELLIASDDIKAMIVTRKRIAEILAQARREGMTTLVQDGIVKVLDGMTDFRQVKSVAIR